MMNIPDALPPAKPALLGDEPHMHRRVSRVRSVKIRFTMGLLLLILSVTCAGFLIGQGSLGIPTVLVFLAWAPAIFLTDKYEHKYPQRYFTYLAASHLKAALLMALILGILAALAGRYAGPPDVLWTAFILFVSADALCSLPWRRDFRDGESSPTAISLIAAESNKDESTGDSGPGCAEASPIDAQAVLSRIRPAVDAPIMEFIEKYLPDHRGGLAEVQVVDDIPSTEGSSVGGPVALLVGRTRVNDVKRLHQFMLYCAGRTIVGGYFTLSYLPLENVRKEFKKRYPRLLYWPVFMLHYLWYRAIPKIPWLDLLYFSPKISWIDRIHLSLAKRRNRALSKAEVWGRLSFCGLRVNAESEGDGEHYILAQRIADPVQNKRPSYYPVVALEKVGLDGEIIRMHKIRTMFPFSEYLQKRIFEDHGLAATGKFRNDFRLTEFGIFLRRYWLDELPQILDWLRGDVKLVGMRATSRHFLSLYPRELLDLYIEIKPGLIPPIFGESTNGFDQIVEVELTYLRSYWNRPFRTDCRYLAQTFTDIVFRGIRSK